MDKHGKSRGFSILEALLDLLALLTLLVNT